MTQCQMINPLSAGYILLAAGYYALSVASVYFNAALIVAVSQVLRGEQVRIRSALSVVLGRLPAILGGPWSAARFR